MPDYYIRTTESEEARGPFDIRKLASLAEAGQVTKATLYYDEENEEWIPVGTDADLCAELFPERKKLSLKPAMAHADGSTKIAEAKVQDDEEMDKEGTDINDLLAAAEGDSSDTKHTKKRTRDAEQAAKYVCPALGLMFVLSAFTLFIPNGELISEAYGERRLLLLLNSPFVIVALFDLLLALFMFLAVTEVFSVIRVRAALGFGFSLYVGWSMGDPLYMAVSAAAFGGIFLAAVTQRSIVMFSAFLLGLGGGGYLLFLSFSGRFANFYDTFRFEWFGG
ncbi:MAG: DUF4339 domain-containing protein [Puniceicoccaceae bacterium]|nr:MAG: DUF4339 domain-containing protein [Puniceicoccaceae bacterium]